MIFEYINICFIIDINMSVKTLKFRKSKSKSPDFEILPLDRFFATRAKDSLERDNRINFWTLLYIIEGEGYHSIDYIEHKYKSGDLIVIANSLVHSFRVNYNVKGYIIIINEPFFLENSEKYDMDMLSFFETPIGEPILHLDVSKELTSRNLIDLLYKEYINNESFNSKLLKSLFVSFVYSIRVENKDNILDFTTTLYQHYYNYRKLVNDNFTTLKNVSEYSTIMGLSKKTINKACRKCVGASAKSIITSRIILEAKRLILQEKLMMYEISDELGFDEPANFANFFKHNTGLTVKQFKIEQDNQHLGKMF